VPPPFLLDQPRNNPPGRTSASINSTNTSAPAVTEARTGHRRTGSAAFPQAAMRISMASFTADERSRDGPKQRLPTSAHSCKECGISNLSVIAEYERKTGDGLSPGADLLRRERKGAQISADIRRQRGLEIAREKNGHLELASGSSVPAAFGKGLFARCHFQ
jgi:hypothetical protein